MQCPVKSLSCTKFASPERNRPANGIRSSKLIKNNAKQLKFLINIDTIKEQGTRNKEHGEKAAEKAHQDHKLQAGQGPYATLSYYEPQDEQQSTQITYKESKYYNRENIKDKDKQLYFGI